MKLEKHYLSNDAYFYLEILEPFTYKGYGRVGEQNCLFVSIPNVFNIRIQCEFFDNYYEGTFLLVGEVFLGNYCCFLRMCSVGVRKLLLGVNKRDEF